MFPKFKLLIVISEVEGFTLQFRNNLLQIGHNRWPNESKKFNNLEPEK